MLSQGRLAVVTGASTGIGLELARLCAEQGYHLIIAADERLIEEAALELEATGVSCTPVQCDLATAEGVQQLICTIQATDRPVADGQCGPRPGPSIPRSGSL